MGPRQSGMRLNADEIEVRNWLSLQMIPVLADMRSSILCAG